MKTWNDTTQCDYESAWIAKSNMTETSLGIAGLLPNSQFNGDNGTLGWQELYVYHFS